MSKNAGFQFTETWSLKLGMYPLFIPPERLLKRRNSQEWTPEEVQVYFDWLIKEKDKRISDLLAHLKATMPKQGEEVPFLTRIGKAVSEMLRSSPYVASKAGAPALSGEGSALAADMGLLIAELLIRASGQRIQWGLVRDPDGSLVVNVPIIIGNKPTMWWDPLRGAITEGRAMCAGKRMETIWADMFSVWQKKLLT